MVAIKRNNLFVAGYLALLATSLCFDFRAINVTVDANNSNCGFYKSYYLYEGATEEYIF